MHADTHDQVWKSVTQTSFEIAVHKQAWNMLDQLAESQLGFWLSNTSNRSGGISDGIVEAVGIFWKNSSTLFLDRASAASFLTPAMCSADNIMLNLAQMKKRHLSRCMAAGFLLVCLLIITTTAALSQ